jgi:hypothetical protein
MSSTNRDNTPSKDTVRLRQRREDEIKKSKKGTATKCCASHYRQEKRRDTGTNKIATTKKRSSHGRQKKRRDTGTKKGTTTN